MCDLGSVDAFRQFFVCPFCKYINRSVNKRVPLDGPECYNCHRNPWATDRHHWMCRNGHSTFYNSAATSLRCCVCGVTRSITEPNDVAWVNGCSVVGVLHETCGIVRDVGAIIAGYATDEVVAIDCLGDKCDGVVRGVLCRPSMNRLIVLQHPDEI